MSPDTVSSLFPDRPIRPLPRRRLRETLSPELADSIKYPPPAHGNGNIPLFFYPPYTRRDEPSPPSAEPAISPVEQGRRSERRQSHNTRYNGVGTSQHEDESNRLRSTLVTRSPPEILNRSPRRASRPDQTRAADPQPPHSAASSVDGYDSFENTNNKKKRKIPSAGDTALASSHGMHGDSGSLAVSGGPHSPDHDGSGDRPYGPSSPGLFTSNGQGISGSGRGRLGQPRNGRSPLRALSDVSNSLPGRAVKAGTPQWAQTGHEGAGIISSAIANAEKLPPQGQENISLLQQHSMVRPSPTSTQFTFTCDSRVPGSLQWPGNMPRNNMGTQTRSGAPSTSHHANNSGHHGESSKAASGDSLHSRRRSRRRLDRELEEAARHRRQRAHEINSHSSSRLEEKWICPLCEYEMIFKTPPRILTRDYEIKDRRRRKEEADRRRLLEKAKAKSRKNRRAGKAPSKGSSSMNDGSQSQAEVDYVEDNGPPTPTDHAHSHSTQSDDDYEYDFDDGPEPKAPPAGGVASFAGGGGM